MAANQLDDVIQRWVSEKSCDKKKVYIFISSCMTNCLNDVSMTATDVTERQVINGDVGCTVGNRLKIG